MTSGQFFCSELFLTVALFSAFNAAGYQYTADLLALEQSKTSDTIIHDQALCKIITPLRAGAWETCLQAHPDRLFAQYICKGIAEGFHIGFNREVRISPAKSNMGSAAAHPSVVSDYIAKELLKNRTIPYPLIPQQVSRFGVIPKKHQPGEWRLIVDLSAPEGKSVNDGISKSLCSLNFITVRDVAAHVHRVGKGALMAKMDVKSAFRNIPVHPDDRLLLGTQWENQYFVDTVLPFGLRSAPKIFNAVADALQWIVKQKGVAYVEHYLDDFITVGAPDSDECADNLSTLLHSCSMLGMPVAPDKTEAPTPIIVFLGIEIDSIKQQLRLPQEKLARILKLLRSWSGRRTGTKKELQSLAGTLEDAARIIIPGKAFLRRIYDAAASLAKSHHHIRLNSDVRSDIAWWLTFMTEWNGISLFSTLCELAPSAIVTSDASGHWGCGAYFTDQWFQIPWSVQPEYADENIASKELLPITIAAAVWGPQWQGRKVLSRCDNMAVVSVLCKRSCRDKNLMHLLRCLHFFEAHYRFHLISEHIRGIDNELADDLSRNHLSAFLQKSGLLTPPTVISPDLLDMLMGSRPDWTSPSWKQMFKGILNKA